MPAIKLAFNTSNRRASRCVVMLEKSCRSMKSWWSAQAVSVSSDRPKLRPPAG